MTKFYLRNEELRYKDKPVCELEGSIYQKFEQSFPFYRIDIEQFAKFVRAAADRHKTTR